MNRAPQQGPQRPQQPQQHAPPLTQLQQMLSDPSYHQAHQGNMQLPRGHPAHYPAPQQQQMRAPPTTTAAPGQVLQNQPQPVPQQQQTQPVQQLLPSGNLRGPVLMKHSQGLERLPPNYCWATVIQTVPVFIPGTGMVKMPMELPVPMVRVPVRPPQPAPQELREPQPHPQASPTGTAGRAGLKRRCSGPQPPQGTQAVPLQPTQHPANLADALRQVMIPTPAPEQHQPTSPPTLKRVCPNIPNRTAKGMASFNGHLDFVASGAPLRKMPPPLPNRATKENSNIRMPQA